jgi:hypothetical protein
VAEGKDQPIVIVVVVEHPTFNKSTNAFILIILDLWCAAVNKYLC